MNLAPACSRCNSQKGGRTSEQWQAWCEQAGRPWPPAGAVWTRDTNLAFPPVRVQRNRSRAARRARVRWRVQQRAEQELREVQSHIRRVEWKLWRAQGAARQAEEDLTRVRSWLRGREKEAEDARRRLNVADETLRELNAIA